MKQFLTRLISVATLFMLLATGTALAGVDEAMEAYERGDKAAAFELMQRAAADGNEIAYGKLASFYLYGIGTEKNYSEAYVWFGIAMATGDMHAKAFKKTAAAAMSESEVKSANQRLKELKSGLGL